MFPCPHCGKSIDVGPPANVPWWKYDGGGVSLGCGTLILIAIIVAMFSRSGANDIVSELRKEMQSLEQKLEKKIDNLVLSPKAVDSPMADPENK